MSSNKKLLRQKKYLRRLNELKKASARVDTRVVLEKSKEEQVGVGEVVPRIADSGKYQLPIEEIKKDLVKNLVFAVFSVVLVVGLKITGFGFEQIKHLLNL
jgi:hypothetical protein